MSDDQSEDVSGPEVVSKVTKVVGVVFLLGGLAFLALGVIGLIAGEEKDTNWYLLSIFVSLFPLIMGYNYLRRGYLIRDRSRQGRAD